MVFLLIDTGRRWVGRQSKLAQILYDADYQGFLAVETDSLHPDYENREHWAVEQSVANLKKIAAAVKQIRIAEGVCCENDECRHYWH